MNWKHYRDNTLKAAMLLLTVGMLIGHSSDSGPSSIEAKSCSDAGENGYCLQGLDTASVMADLQGVEVIEGSLFISETGMSDLTGLESLTEIGGDLIIYEDAELTSLRGLENLQRIGGMLTIYNAVSLVDLNGLDAVEIVQDGIEMEANAAMVSLNGLNSLTSLPGGIIVSGQYLFSSLEALSNVTGSMTKLVIIDAPVTSLQPLMGVNAITEEINIDSTQLIDLSGLEQLEPFTGELVVRGNADSLGNLEGDPSPLASIAQLHIGDSLVTLNITKEFEKAEWPDFSKLTSIEEDLFLPVLSFSDLEDAFPLLTSVGGSLGLSKSPTIDVELDCERQTLSDVDVGFDSLESVGNELSLETNCSVAVDGFERLQSVGDELWINGRITAIPEFPALQSLGGLIVNAPVKALFSLDDVELVTTSYAEPPSVSLSYTEVRELPALRLPAEMRSIQIVGNEQLIDVDTLQVAELSLRHELIVKFNNSLQSIAGLGSIRSSELIDIWGNPNISDLSSLQGIESAIVINIKDNDTLPSLAVFDDIEHLYSLRVEGNAELSTFGFDKLTVVDEEFRVISNPRICQPQMEFLVDNQIAVGGEVEIEDNQEFCVDD
ncbi:hypothetical protein EZV61_18590 [Corallincola luteus]|uniref:Receptor L-domain domain-containing protein n=1 Tax=Corallincola luteus TaxID=1775177 RepID=A0ABY2AFT0_9GAMM|nr:hypothetical protein [Corallincola luteus]TCI01286.1 hypothetical protein EZV61_18590 [Corallincola luteus]